MSMLKAQEIEAMPVFIAKPKRKTSELFTKLIVEVAAFFYNAWIVMLLLGGIHSNIVVIPALGYNATMMVVLLITYLFRLGSRDKFNFYLQD